MICTYLEPAELVWLQRLFERWALRLRRPVGSRRAAEEAAPHILRAYAPNAPRSS